MRHLGRDRDRGYILLPVVIALTLLGAIAFQLNSDSALNSNLAGGRFQADSARYVAEAGLAQLNYRVQNANCAGYPTLSGAAFGSDTFSASSSPTSGSPVTLIATGTTAGGASSSLTRTNVPVYRTTPYTITLQPAIQLQDTYIRNGGSATKNFGGDDKLKIDGGGARALLRFDLSSIPSTAIVESAQLMLNKKSGGGGPSGSIITAYPLTRAWVEGTLNGDSPADGATWNTSNGTTAWTTPGGDYDASTGATTPSIGSDNVWVSWDITQIAGSWVNGTTANQGVILIGSASVPSQDYFSGRDNTRERTPKLIVTFRARCDWVAPPSSVTLASGSDSYVDKNTPAVNYGSSASVTLADKVDLRGLFQFDTSGVTPGSLLINAKLRLYVTSLDTRSGSTMNLEVRPLTSTWAETAVSWTRRTGTNNWSSQGGDFGGPTATLAVPSTFSGGWIEFDITSLAQAWVDGIMPNLGVIVLEKSDDRFFVASKEAGTATSPQLVLSY